MLKLHSELMNHFNAVLRKKGIPLHDHNHYRKWLRYYPDFCRELLGQDEMVGYRQIFTGVPRGISRYSSSISVLVIAIQPLVQSISSNIRWVWWSRAPWPWMPIRPPSGVLAGYFYIIDLLPDNVPVFFSIS